MNMMRADVGAVEADLQWEALPEAPRSLRRLLAQAGSYLVAYVRQRDEQALADLAEVLDRAVAHRAWARADREFRLALLNRDAIAHNWLGASSRPDARRHLDESIVILRRGIADAGGDTSRTLWRLQVNLSNGLVQRYQNSGNPEDLDAAVRAAENAMEVLPAGQLPFLANSALATALRVRYRRNGDRADLEQATEHARAAVTACPEGPRRDYFRFVLSDVLQVRYDVTGSLADLDEAENLLRECLAASVTPVQLSRKGLEGTLGAVLRRRFIRTGAKADIDEAIALMSKEPENPGRLTNLGNALLDRFRLSGDVHDLEGAVNAQIASVEATPPGDWQLASRHNNAGNALSAAADYTGDDDLARRAINSFRQALELTGPDAPERASREYNLARMLEALCHEERSGPLVDETRLTYGDAVQHGLYGSLEWALAAAKAWGRWASRREAWPEAADAYNSAIDITQQVFRVQLARPQQEAWLAESQGVPGEAAHAMARAKRLREAVEALERGRILLLSDALDRDRADLSLLNATHPALAGAYREAASAVESALSSSTAGPEAIRSTRARLDAVISEIRAVPEHAGFLAAPTFDDITSFATAAGLPSGAVLAYLAPASAGGVALLVSCDAAEGENVRAVELPRCTVAACRRRAEALLAARVSDDVSSGAFAGTLDAVTRWLWEAIIGPIVVAFDKPHRIVLVPTGLLTLLPVHAAWTDDDGLRRYLVDEAVVSYAPSARTLLAWRA